MVLSLTFGQAVILLVLLANLCGVVGIYGELRKIGLAITKKKQ